MALSVIPAQLFWAASLATCSDDLRQALRLNCVAHVARPASIFKRENKREEVT